MSTVFCLHRTHDPFDVHRGAATAGGSVKAASFIRNGRYVGAVFLAMDGSSLRRFGILQQAHAGHVSLRAIQKWRRDGRGGIRPATPPSPCAKGSNSVLPYEP